MLELTLDMSELEMSAITTVIQAHSDQQYACGHAYATHTSTCQQQRNRTHKAIGLL